MLQILRFYFLSIAISASSFIHNTEGTEQVQVKKISIEVGNAEDWFSGPSFKIIHPEFSKHTFYFWPQESWSQTNRTGSEWEFIERGNFGDISTSADGIISYELQNLLNPKVSFKTELIPSVNDITVIYSITNGSDDSLYIITNPCFQLDENLFEGIPPQERNSYISISLPNGIATMDKTELNPGSKEDKPWTQIYFSKQNPFKPVNHGFGLNKENVSHGFIYMTAPNEELSIMIASDHCSSVAYAFLNCLHVDIGTWAEPGKTREVRYKIYFGKGIDTIKKRSMNDFQGLPFETDK